MHNFWNKLLVTTLSFSLIFNSVGGASPQLGITKLGDENKDKDKVEGITTPIMEYPVGAQYFNNFFEDGKMPQTLIDFRSQQYLLKQHSEEIIQRSEQDKSKPLVTVAVMDIGVDLENESLRNKIKFDIKDGKVVGAGFDFMSMTPWGTHQLLDPWIYAIGAESINQYGQIKTSDSVKSPVKYLLAANDRIVNQVLERIKQSSSLNGTLFSKINSSNINMLGLLRLAQMPVSPEEYTANEKANSLSNLKTSPQLDIAWTMTPSSGIPDVLESRLQELSSLQGSVEFQRIVTDVIKLPENISLIKKEITNLNKFFQAHHFPAGATTADLSSYSMMKMSGLLALNKLGTQVETSLFDYFLLVKKIKIENPELKWDALIEQSLLVYESLLKSYYEQNVKTGEYKEIKNSQQYLEELNFLKKFVYEQNKENKLGDIFETFFTTGRLPWIKGFSSAQRKMIVRGINPLLHPEAPLADHGSHVSGTMSAYHENYRIFPIRVSLGMVKGNALVQQQFVERNRVALSEWLQSPIVARSVLNTLKNDAKVSKATLNYNVESEGGRKKFVEFLMSGYFEEYLKMNASQSGIVSQSLHWEIEESAKMLAQRKIPFANLSLGGEIEQPEYDRYQDNDSEKIKATLDFVFSEFQKFKIAEAVSTHGKNTLYMMAAGNSKNYADNDSRTDYPAGLSSPWLAKNRKAGEKLPSDGMSNVTIVMSMNEINKLSNFTNLILSGEQVIAIRGEDVLSQTTSHSQWGVRKTFRRILPEVRFFDYDPEDGRFAKFLKDSNFPESLVKTYVKIAKSFVQVSRLILFQKYNDKMDLKDGTSMATPTAVAMASQIFQKKLERLGKKLGRLVTEEEVYGKEGFTPKDIMDIVIKNTKAENYGPNVKIKKLKNAKNQEVSKKEVAFTEHLTSIRNSSILCLRYYQGAR